MTIWWHIGILLGFGLVLSACAELVVRAALGIAKRAGLTSFTIGFLLLGVVTSTPEMFVAIQASIEGIPQLSAGNVLGGSILLLSLVMGFLAVAGGKLTLTKLRWQDLVSTSAVIAAPAIVLWDGALTRGDGFFLVGSYAIHGFLIARDGRNGASRPSRVRWRGRWHIIGMLVLGIVGLAFASRMMVQSAEIVINAFNIAPVLFGLFVLSFGTNLPELALAVGSLKSKGEDIAIGDFLGSSAANTLILGLLGIFSPFVTTDPKKTAAALVLLASVTVFFLWSFSTGRSISRKEGFGLLSFYAVFVLYELFA